jgi:hypothetical protein
MHPTYRTSALPLHNPEFGRTGPTRLELATSGVTGRHSNQLSYDPKGLCPVTTVSTSGKTLSRT